MSSVITLAVSGPAPCTYANVEALLNDRLGLGEKDAQGNFMLLKDTDPGLQINVVAPVTDARYTDGVENVLRWAEPAMAGSIALIDSHYNATGAYQAFTRSSQRVLLDDVDEGLLDILNEHRRCAADVALLVCFDPENPDEDTILLMLKAATYDIPILNLSLGLAPIDAYDYGGVIDVPMDDDGDLEDAAALEEPEQPAEHQQLDAFDAVAEAEESATPEQPDEKLEQDLPTLSKVVAHAQERVGAPYTYGDNAAEPFDIHAQHFVAGVATVTQSSPENPAPDDGALPMLSVYVGPEVPTSAIVEQLHSVMDLAKGLLDALRSRLGTAPAQPPAYDPATELPPIPVVLEKAAVKPAVKTERWFKDPVTGELRKAGRGRPRKNVEYVDLPVEA